MSSDRLERLLEASTDQDVLVADNMALYDRHAGRTSGSGSIHICWVRGCDWIAAASCRCKTNQPMLSTLPPEALIRAAHIRRTASPMTSALGMEKIFALLSTSYWRRAMLVLAQAYYQYTERFGSISKKHLDSARLSPHDLLEAQARELARQPRCAEVASQLIQRQMLLRRKRRLLRSAAIGDFETRPHAAALADPDLRSHFSLRVRTLFADGISQD